MLAARSSAVREKKIAAPSVFKHLRRCTCRARSASFHALAGGAPRPCTHLHRCRAHCAVIDAFTTTWGPCEMVASYFSNYYFDLGEELGRAAEGASLVQVSDRPRRKTPASLVQKQAAKARSKSGSKSLFEARC